MYNKEIFSDEGERIIHLNFKEHFTNPYFVFDILGEKEKTPEIKVSSDVGILKEIDFTLYAQPTSKPWAKRQKHILYLMPENSPIEENFKQLNKLPANHYFEVDIANSKIRLVGPFVKEGISDWLMF